MDKLTRNEMRQVRGKHSDLKEAIRLLNDLADLQNGAPLEQHRKEWEDTMEEVYNFLKKYEL